MNKSPSVPGFLTKTHEIFNSPQYQDICCWGPNGNTINVKKIEQFSKEILPKYFKHSNYQSFVRQLNMYDFHKIVQDPNNGEFQHQYFVKDRPDLLVNIKRKANNRTAESLKKLSKSSSLSTLPPPPNNQHHNMNTNIVHHMVGKDNGPRIEEVDEYDDNIANLLPDELLVETDTVLTELDQQRLMHDDFVQKMETRMEKLEHENELLKNLVKESNKKTMIMQERMTKVMKTIYSVFAANPHMGQALLSRMPSLAIEGPSFSSPLAMITDGSNNGTTNSTDMTLRRLPSYDPYSSYNASTNNNSYLYTGLNNPLAGTEIAAASRGTSFDVAAASVTAPFVGSRDRALFGLGAVNSTIVPVESDRVTLLSDDSPVSSPSKQPAGSSSNKNSLKRAQETMSNSVEINSIPSEPPLKLQRVEETEIHDAEPIVTSPTPPTNISNHDSNEDLLGPTFAPEQLAQIEPQTRDFIDLLNRNQKTTLTRLNSLEQTLALLLEDIEDDGFLSKLQADSSVPTVVQPREDDKNDSATSVNN